MAKVAIVTGGTRGIGAAIAKGLKEAGHTVAATYRGNDEAAAKFNAETGVAIYKWDVAARQLAHNHHRRPLLLDPPEFFIVHARARQREAVHVPLAQQPRVGAGRGFRCNGLEQYLVSLRRGRLAEAVQHRRQWQGCRARQARREVRSEQGYERPGGQRRGSETRGSRRQGRKQ